MRRRSLLTSTIVLCSALLLSACIVRPPTGAPDPEFAGGGSSTPASAAPSAEAPAGQAYSSEGPSGQAPAAGAPAPEAEHQVIQVADPLEAEAYAAYEAFVFVELAVSQAAVLDSRELEAVTTAGMAADIVAELGFLRSEGALVAGAPRTQSFDLLDHSTSDVPVAHVCADVSDVGLFDAATVIELATGEELEMGELLIHFERSGEGRLLVDSRTPVLAHERTCG